MLMSHETKDSGPVSISFNLVPHAEVLIWFMDELDPISIKEWGFLILNLMGEERISYRNKDF